MRAGIVDHNACNLPSPITKIIARQLSSQYLNQLKPRKKGSICWFFTIISWIQLREI